MFSSRCFAFMPLIENNRLLIKRMDEETERDGECRYPGMNGVRMGRLER